MQEKLIKVLITILNGLYCIFKLLPVKRKITYISRQSDALPTDFDLVINEMKRRRPEYKQVALTKMIGKSFLEKIGYCFHMLRQMYHIATSEMVVLDSYCIAVSILHQRKSLIVIQMWHALGAMKKFGYSILDKAEGTKKSLAKTMRMHRNYSYVFSSSDFCSRYFAEGFGVSLEQIVVMPLPRLDLLSDTEYIERKKEAILSRYPKLKDKKTIAYAPTFRKEDDELKEESLKAATERLVEAIDFDKYNLVVKFHPLSDITIQNENVIVDKSFSTVEVCFWADAVILDYSAVVFEVAMLDKPMYFYTFDYDTYMENRDVYIDYKECVPGVIAKDPQELMMAIEKNLSDPYKLTAFKDQMISKPNSIGYTADVVNFFEKILNEH